MEKFINVDTAIKKIEAPNLHFGIAQFANTGDKAYGKDYTIYYHGIFGTREIMEMGKDELIVLHDILHKILPFVNY